ncbi:hypothetical protein VTJ83DRAFT_3396 [Remersonia thermophila]|uniref:Uncharacterized protein n=1 Tax=Remersonia thermophila TaxID=72144 RepID=A0ABR4DDW4_9PEZI
MALINAANKVHENQQYYQAAYKAHTRLWRINPRSKIYLRPYALLLWGTTAASLYAMGRRVWGKNTWFTD